MQLNEIKFSQATPIDGYGPGFFRAGGQIVEGAVCVTAAGMRSWGGYEDTQTLLSVVDDIDVLFVGTGAEITHLPAKLRSQLEAAGIGFETMNSPAACRTYNILLSEGRRVAVALLPV